MKIHLTRIGDNQYEIRLDGAGRVFFFSYETLVGVKTKAGIFVQRDGLASSPTTARHIKNWLNGRTAVTVYEDKLNEIAYEGL